MSIVVSVVCFRDSIPFQFALVMNNKMQSEFHIMKLICRHRIQIVICCGYLCFHYTFLYWYFSFVSCN